MENEIKPMNKKELIKRIEEFKPKYIYQRYNGRICKYEVINNNYLVETKTGMSFDFRSHLMLGKVSENLIDLIQVGDYVNGKYVEKIEQYKDGKSIIALIGIIDEADIKEVVTKEQFESISYKVKE